MLATPPSTLAKLLVIAMLFAGEALAISAEMVGARMHGLAAQPYLRTFLLMMAPMLLGAMLLVSGYILGFRTFRNIWLVSAISITSILIVEPILAWTLFHQVPTKGALLGLLFGAAGFASALLL